MSDPSRPSGKGLYDPAFEHDSCGVGFIARLDARPDHAVIRDAVEILVNLEHRGAVGGDKATGDGAGLLVQIPDALFQEVCRESGFTLPEQGGYGVGIHQAVDSGINVANMVQKYHLMHQAMK